jgi:hypothetical protein
MPQEETAAGETRYEQYDTKERTLSLGWSPLHQLITDECNRISDHCASRQRASYSTASSIRELVNRQSLGLRRWRSKASKASHPFGDRSDVTQSTYSDTTNITNGYTTFLPELYSTPPMPSFQKPHPGGVVTTRNAADTSSFPRQNRVSNRTETLGLLENKLPLQTHTKINAQSPITKRTTLGRDVSSLLSSTTTRVRTRIAPFPPQDHHDRPIPPLPSNWTQQHDKAICILDVKNYSHPAMIVKLRRTFPSLCGPLTPVMIDKRLQQLDQNVELDYYSAGIQKESRVVRAKLPLPPLPPPPLIPRRSWLRGGQDDENRELPATRKSDETARLAEVGPPVLKVRLTAQNPHYRSIFR